MMNLNRQPHHNIFGCRSVRSSVSSASQERAKRQLEGGYTLVALLALMSMLALFAMAVAPSIHQQTQREREREAIFRGEQVAEAIKAYYSYRSTTLHVVGDQALPSSMDQLLQGIPIPGGSKNRQILRASAARDPLTIEGEWRFIHPRSEALIEFQQAVLLYCGTISPRPQDSQVTQLQQLAVPQIVSVLNVGTTSRSSSSSSAGDDSSGPFVGVASRSRNSSVLTFYGIESHDQWIFTPLFRK
jgi:type II secretory pathway pseudopilin PulG